MRSSLARTLHSARARDKDLSAREPEDRLARRHSHIACLRLDISLDGDNPPSWG